MMCALFRLTCSNEPSGAHRAVPCIQPLGCVPMVFSASFNATGRAAHVQDWEGKEQPCCGAKTFTEGFGNRSCLTAVLGPAGCEQSSAGLCPGVVNPADEKSGSCRWVQPSVLGSAQVYLILQRRNKVAAAGLSSWVC